MNLDIKQLRFCVTGGAGFLGRVVCELLKQRGATYIVVPRSREFDLTRPDAVRRMFDVAKPDVVIHLAAEVGGIGANQRHPGRFFFANMAMGLNLIEESRQRGVQKFVQVGSVCGYPKHCPVPFHEDELWNGYPEETNAPYGVTKRALGVMLEAYRHEYKFNGVYLVPVNLYGPGDNFDLERSHVIPALIRKFCDAVDSGAKRVVCWGTGRVTREFLYVDDAAEAIVRATEIHNDSAPINLGTGTEITIHELARQIAVLCGFQGEIAWDPTQPDGQPRRQLDVTRAAQLLRWQAKTKLIDGLRATIEWWKLNRNSPVSNAQRNTKVHNDAPVLH